MPVLTTTYSANTTIVMNLTTLASSATYIAGRESNQIDNTTTQYIDAIVYGDFTVGTTPGITGGLVVYVWGSEISLVTTPLKTLDGAATLTCPTWWGRFPPLWPRPG